MPNLMGDHSGNNGTPGFESDQIIANVYRQSALTLEGKPVGIVIREVRESGDAFDKVRVDYICIGTSKSGAIAL